MNKGDTPEALMKAMALEHIWTQGEDKSAIYTDGSKSEDGKVGAGV